MRPLLVIPAALLLGCHLLLPVRGGAARDRSPGTLELPGFEVGNPSCPAMAVDSAPFAANSCCDRCGQYTGPGRIVWPAAVGPEIVSQCSTSGPTACNATGVCAATFLRYGGCPAWKEYDLPPGCKDVDIWGCSDGCTSPGNVLTNVSFTVEEPQGASWAVTKEVDRLDLKDTCDCVAVQHTATSSKLRIHSKGPNGFYVCLFVR